LEKIDLPGQRHVMLHHAFAPLTDIFCGAEVREESKVVNQMRLVVIAAIHGHSPPIWRDSALHRLKGSLKTLHATEQLWQHPDFPCEQLNESALTQTRISHDIANCQVSINARESDAHVFVRLLAINLDDDAVGVVTLVSGDQRLARNSHNNTTSDATARARYPIGKAML
jgi:hypothetical protein